MIISETTWREKFIARLRKINEAAVATVLEYLTSHSLITLQEWNALIDYAYSVSSAYGESAASIACEFYDAVAVASGINVLAATPAETATYQEVAKAIRGTGKTGNTDLMASAVGRMVKMAGVDTTMQNALRDGAEWAWIPSGDSCALCLVMASRGWQKATKSAIKKGHASHIHANCDCSYAVRFDSETTVAGYDPESLQYIYDQAGGDNVRDKTNSIRRGLYLYNKDKINEQKRQNYADRIARETTE